MYNTKVLGEIKYGSSAWKGLKIGVFRIENGKEEKVGEYERNYSTFYNTFYFFQKDGKDFALYSPDYTVTRIMELPACKDIGGEEPKSSGFCPVDYFVPTYIQQEYIWDYESEKEQKGKTIINNPENKDIREGVTTRNWINQITKEECESKSLYRSLTPILYHPFGFAAGCIWGDDSSWKIQFLDLSEAEKGIIKRDDRFGYIELPENQNLREAIDMYDYGYDKEDYSDNIRINVMQTFNLKTGKNLLIK